VCSLQGFCVLKVCSVSSDKPFFIHDVCHLWRYFNIHSCLVFFHSAGNIL
jgi:hypothetical protein